MLYDEQTRKVCALCQHACDFRGDELLCRKKGPVSFDYHCRHFQYDPMRRKPAAPAPAPTKLTAEAFQL